MPAPSIAFITPFPSVLKHDWYKDLIYQKVGIANLAGYLKRAGISRVSQYDFNNQVLRAYAKTPGKVRLMLYADEAAVARYLAGRPEPALRRQTSFFLDTLKVKKHDIFGLSLAGFLGDTAEIALGARLAQCLAAELKRRWPGSTVLLGGMQNMSTEFLDREYQRVLEACPYIDYAVCGEAHAAILAVCRAVEKKVSFESLKLEEFTWRRAGKACLVQLSPAKDHTAPIMRYFRPLPEGQTRDPGVPFGYPAYDPVNSRAYAYTGDQVRRFYHLPRLPSPKAAAGLNYLTLQVSFSEGCPFNCYFCGNATTEFFSLELDEAVEILKRLRGELDCRHFLFYNPNFNPSYRYAASFLEKLIKADLGLLWADCFNLRHMDRNLAAMMREAGCIKAIAGVEYPTARMLKYINKGIDPDQVNRGLEELHRAGIWNHVLLITGMPTETMKDVEELEAWLRLSKDWVNAYTVGSFHLVEGSPFHRQAEKFGFRLKDPLQLYCQSGFDEKNGLRWEDKVLQNAETNRRVRDYIDRLKGSRKPTASRMDDSHLLMYLYRMLGHGQKRRIEELYEAAYTVNPHIAKAWAALKPALSPRAPLGRALAAAGLRAELAPPRRESLTLSLDGAGAAADCSIMARNEEILINPADNRVHGDYFALQAGGRPPADRLTALVSAAGGRLSLEPAPAGRAAVRLTLPGGQALFVISAAKRPALRTMTSGRVNKTLAAEVGRLLLEKAAPRRDRSPRLSEFFPAILKAAEAWAPRAF